MRQLLLWAVLLVGVACIAGCRSSSVPGLDTNGTVSIRYFAAMSMPAFLPDGSKFVINGDNLLKYSATDAFLGSVALPLKGAGTKQAFTLQTRLLSTESGKVFIFLGDGRVGRLNADGLFEWLQDFGATPNGALVAGDTLITMCNSNQGSVLNFIDADGNILQTLEHPRYAPVADGTGAEATVFCTLDSMLFAARPSGELLLEYASFSSLDVPEPVAASNGRVLLRDVQSRGHLLCADSNGAVVWEQQLATGIICSGVAMLFSDGGGVIGVNDNNLHQSSMLVLGPDGALVEDQAGINLQRVVRINNDTFAAQYASELDLYFAAFSNTGDQTWAFPQPARNSGPGANLDRVYYMSVTDILYGADQRLYFTYESTLHALDMTGQLAWREPGQAYANAEVPGSTAPSTGGTGGGGTSPRPTSSRAAK